MDPLDDPAAWRRLDPHGMLRSIEELPEQCRQAWQAAQGMKLPARPGEIDRIVVLGMGGSAIAGDILRVLLERESAVPVFNHRQYDLPPCVDERTLVIASSFSGSTEETLSAFRQALATPAPKLAITTGGPLLAAARANGVPAFVFRFQGEPRSALGWSLMPLLAVARGLGLAPGIERDVEEAAAVMEGLRARIGAAVPGEENPAKGLARRLLGKLPVVYGAGVLREAARRWKTQLNESAKVWAFHEEMPEANHNALVSYALPLEIARRTLVVFLRAASVHPRVLLRYGFTQGALERAGVEWAEVEGEGKSALAQAMSAILFGDYVACYLAILNGVSPAPTTAIDELKGWLASHP